MSEISETQRKLLTLMNHYEAAVIGENRGRNRPYYSEKVDVYYQKRRELQEFVAELEKENAMLKQLSQPIEFWSDEKIQIYKSNESRSVKSGNEEVQE